MTQRETVPPASHPAAHETLPPNAQRLPGSSEALRFGPLRAYASLPLHPETSAQTCGGGAVCPQTKTVSYPYSRARVRRLRDGGLEEEKAGLAVKRSDPDRTPPQFLCIEGQELPGGMSRGFAFVHFAYPVPK